MNTDDLLLSDGGTNAGPGKKSDKKRGGRKAWTTETKTEEEIKTEAEAVPETETRTETEAEAESKNEKKTNSEEKFSVLSLKEEKLRDKRLNKICRLADRVVDRLTGAVEELETTDTQRFRQIVASIISIFVTFSPGFISCRIEIFPCGALESCCLPFAKIAFMAFCSTSAVSFEVLMDRATTFSFTSSCIYRPPFDDF